MAQLPNSKDPIFTRWKALLDPVLANTILQGNQISGVVLVANTPFVVNHLLSRQMIGWFITDQNANAQVWRTQPLNSKTLTLEASANVTVNIWCY